MAIIPLPNINTNTRQSLHNIFIKLYEFYKYMQHKGVDGNEALTRELLIRPFIKALGYIVDSEQKNATILLDLWPEISGHEDNDNRCDFLIRLNPQIDNVHAVIEAKPVNRDLDTSKKGDRGTPTNQLRKYFDSKDWKANVILGILTNGYEYRFFKNKDTVNPNDSGMEDDPFFKTNLKELSENKDNCIDILNYYVCKKVIEACSRISTKEDNNILVDSAQKSFSEHVKRVNQIMKVRSIILEKIRAGISAEYLRNLINEVDIDEDKKEQNRMEFSLLIWSKVPELRLSYYTLAVNAAKKRKDDAEKEYNEWIAIVKSTLDEFEENDDGVAVVGASVPSSEDIIESAPDAPEQPKLQSIIITTAHELAVRDCIQKAVGDLCEVKYIDNVDYIDYVISSLSNEKLKEKEGIKKAKDSKDCVFCLRYGKQDRKLEDHPQEGNYSNALLTFFAAFVSKESETNERCTAIELTNKIKEAGKEPTRGYNGWISVPIQSMDDINDLKDAIKYWFGVRKDEFSVK